MHNHIFSDNRTIQLIAAKAWSLWTGRIVTHCFEEEYALDENEDDEKLINDSSTSSEATIFTQLAYAGTTHPVVACCSGRHATLW